MALEDAGREVDRAFSRPDLRGPAFENSFAGATSFLRRRYTKDLAGAGTTTAGVCIGRNEHMFIPKGESVTAAGPDVLAPRPARVTSPRDSRRRR